MAQFESAGGLTGTEGPYPEGMAKRTRMPTDLKQRAKAIVDLATGQGGEHPRG